MHELPLIRRMHRRPALPRWLAACLLAAGAAVASTSAALYPRGAAAYVVMVDGREWQSQQADTALPPASLTKLMTALLVLESGLPPTTVVTTSDVAARASGARLGLRRGERMAVGELFAAMVLRSANDACLALAEQVAGNEAAFVQAMNRRARQLGLQGTRFTNACGHDAPDHRSTARDLARLAQQAMQDPAYAQVAGQVRTTVRSLAGRSWRLENTNELIGRYDGAIGVKTGYTQAAGRCLVAQARRNGHTVTLVVLGAADRWWDSVAALDAAFAALPSTAGTAAR